MIRPFHIPGHRFRHSCRDAFSAPGKRQNVADLWRVCLFAHEHFCTLIEDAQDLARRSAMGRNERWGLHNWLEPIEKIVRVLLIIRAITYLVMTPEGRKLLRETPKSMPEPPKFAAKPAANSHREIIPYPGWHTIAANRLRPEQIEKQLQQALAAEAEHAAAEARRTGADPTQWSCQFRILGLRGP